MKGICNLLVIGLVALVTIWGCSGDVLAPQYDTPTSPDESSLAKGRAPVCDLVPVGIDNKVVDVYGHEIYTGYEIYDYNKDTASTHCVLMVSTDSSGGKTPAPFISVDSLNQGFVSIHGGTLDTLTGQLVNCWEYYKNQYDPQGQPTLGSGNDISPNGTITPGNFDVYDVAFPVGFQPGSVPTNTQFYNQIVPVDQLGPFQSGINVYMVNYNDARRYKESSYTNDDLVMAFRWVQTYMCYTNPCTTVLVLPPEDGNSAFNGYIENRWITRDVINQLKNMKL